MKLAIRKPIVIMAGGTGGHVFPALAVAEYLRNQGEKIVWLGTRSGIESRLVPAARFEIEWLSIQGLRGSNTAYLVVAPFKIMLACWQAFLTLVRLRPKAVLGMGGFVAGPGGLMAWVLNIPLFLHEQNSVTGLTNRLLLKLATRCYFGFPGPAENVRNSACIGNPVRADLIGLELPAVRLNARKSMPLNVLVVGGSLGAASLNRLLPQAIALLEKLERPEIWHQCGEKHLQICNEQYQQAEVNADICTFIEDMRAAYEWADLAICRAGALTIAELTAVGVASILIPYPHAVDNHQLHNAEFLRKNRAAIMLTEDRLSANTLAETIQRFTDNRHELIAMAIEARKLAKVDATEKLASGILAEVNA